MKVLGLLAGAGTLLWEAREAGFEVVGNVDTRAYFRSAPWVWPLNFDSPFISRIEDLEQAPDDWYDADLALGHPPCGSYSVLGETGGRKERFATKEEQEHWRRNRNQRQGLIPLFVELVNRFRPRMFAMDNLVKMTQTFPKEWWEENLPDYRVSFETIVNWHYGSPQRRPRLWVIGTRGKRSFSLTQPASRLEGPTSAWEAIRDLPWEPWKNIFELAHIHQEIQAKPMGGFWVHDPDEGRRQLNFMTESAMGFIQLPNGVLWPYINNHGRATHKAGQARLHVFRPSRVPTGNETLRHPLTGWPLTVRERARIMGWPDEFKLWGEGVPYDRSTLLKLVRVTGKAVPSEFPRYLVHQARKFLRRK